MVTGVTVKETVMLTLSQVQCNMAVYRNFTKGGIEKRGGRQRKSGSTHGIDGRLY